MEDAVAAWARSGAMALTGPPERALGPPAPLVDGVTALGARITAASDALGQAVELDWLALLAERAALGGLTRSGQVSCGGSTRLLRAAGEWIAASLSRPEDVDLLPAWLGTDDLEDGVAHRNAEDVVEWGAMLGLPVAQLGETARPGVASTSRGPASPVTSLEEVTVVDLTSLWAGPLCTSLLRAAGATVYKVESIARPDAARSAGDGFFDLLNEGKCSIALDLTTVPGRASLRGLLRRADVLVTSARFRAVEQLGLLDHLPAVWVAVTGHGLPSPRVAFGDDAAVAGGLVVRDHRQPYFCADAVADPLSGLAAAAAALEALAEGGRWTIDVAMAGVAASMAGPTLAAEGVAAAPPRARPVGERARPLGADNALLAA